MCVCRELCKFLLYNSIIPTIIIPASPLLFVITVRYYSYYFEFLSTYPEKILVPVALSPINPPRRKTRREVSKRERQGKHVRTQPTKTCRFHVVRCCSTDRQARSFIFFTALSLFANICRKWSDICNPDTQ